jgi:hypothetical protein
VVAAWTVRHVPRLAELASLGVTAVCVEDDALDEGGAAAGGAAGGGATAWTGDEEEDGA